MVEVSGLRVAPVKGLASVSLQGVTLTRDGVAEDRRLFLLRDDGSVVTMRRFPQLTCVVPQLDLAASSLTVTLPDESRATSSLTTAGPRVAATLFGKQRSGVVVDGPVTEALSSYVGERVRVVFAERTGVGWDEGPVSLLGHASVQAVGTPTDSGGPDVARYRMLIDVTGTEPFEEDSWVGRNVGVGTAVVRVSHRLQRCVVIDYVATSGVKDWEGVRTLLSRRGQGDPTLGVIGEVEEPGEVRVGDRVEVLSWAVTRTI